MKTAKQRQNKVNSSHAEPRKARGQGNDTPEISYPTPRQRDVGTYGDIDLEPPPVAKGASLPDPDYTILGRPVRERKDDDTTAFRRNRRRGLVGLPATITDPLAAVPVISADDDPERWDGMS